MSTKPCIACCEPIALKAKVCRHCHQKQDRLALFLTSAASGIVLGAGALGFLFYMAYRENHAFKDFAAQIAVAPATVHVESIAGIAHASCIAEASNNSPHSWRDLAVEARYFNAQGEFIDTSSETQARTHLPAGGSVALRVLDRAARGADSYSRCQLSIKAATSR